MFSLTIMILETGNHSFKTRSWFVKIHTDQRWIPFFKTSPYRTSGTAEDNIERRRGLYWYWHTVHNIDIGTILISEQYWYWKNIDNWNNIDIGKILTLKQYWHWNNIDIGLIYWYWNSFDIGIHIDIGTILILANILILEQFWYRNNIDIGTILILVGVACNDIGTEHNIKTLV